MKTRYFFLMFILAASTVAYSQNQVQNGNFAETTIDETTGLVLPLHWSLDGKALLDDGTFILNLQTKWLPEGAVGGTRALDLWRETDEAYQLKLTQTVTGLSDGVYSLSADAAFGGENVFALYAKVGETETTVFMTESGDFEKKELNNIQVTGGTAIVGFTANSSSAANWFDITNFELVRTGDLTSINKISSQKFAATVTGKSIRVVSEEPILSTRLISIDGKTVYSERSAEKEATFSVSQSGVYILQVKHTSGVQTRKIIVGS
jgi:hypothetical protein